MRIYDVLEQSEYHMQIKRVNNIEDVGEEFLTEEEYNELSLDYDYRAGCHLFPGKIETKLRAIKQEIAEKGKKSGKIKDKDLLHLLAREGVHVSDFVGGLRRVGDRLIIHEPKPKSNLNKRHGKRYLDKALQFIGEENGGFALEVRGGMENVIEGSLKFVKANMKWNAFKKWVKDHYPSKIAHGDFDLNAWKQMYDDPAILNDK